MKSPARLPSSATAPSPRSGRLPPSSKTRKTRAPAISSRGFTARAPPRRRQPHPARGGARAGRQCRKLRPALLYEEPARGVPCKIEKPSRERAPMLRNRDEIREDKAFDQLTDAILQRDQPRTAGLFHRMVTNEGRSIGEALSVVTAAEAPFVQVPCHINIKDGAVVLTTTNPTILALRASTYLMPYLPEKYRLLPLMQSVWYIPAGLDIWNQLLYKYPGRYATMKGVQVPSPPYGPVVWQQDQEPIHEIGSVEDRLHSHMAAPVARAPRRSYSLFPALTDDH